MWPKMMLELLPHLSRLVPMLDTFFSSKGANDRAVEAALATMAAASQGVRHDLGEVTAAHTSLYRQMQEQGARTDAQIAALEQETQYARIVTERLEAALRQAEGRIASLTAWLKGGVLMIVLLLVVLLVLALVHRSV